MRKIYYYLPLLFCFMFAGCLKDKLTHTYTIYTPVYKQKSEVYANIKSNTPGKVENPGKLFLYGNYIFLNEADKGIHVIDNSDPSHPVIKTFINIPGCLDIAVKGNTLYADLYSDLVVVDISNPLQARYVKHIANVFPQRNYANGFVADTSLVIVDWIKKDTTIKWEDVCSRCNIFYATNQSSSGNGGTAATIPAGIAGSMARFSLVNNYLYTVNHSSLISFDISNSNNPVQTASGQVGWNIETIYPFNNKLFIGSSNGMFIYDISNPALPVPQGQFQHIRSCDPVIADGDYAFVTLRSGTTCAGNVNELQVLDISNFNNPFLINTYPMTSPHGLTKDNDLLFICDGKSGLKMYKAGNPFSLALLKKINNIETYDAIAANGNLLVVAKDGLYQYGYSLSGKLNFKSKIPVSH